MCRRRRVSKLGPKINSTTCPQALGARTFLAAALKALTAYQRGKRPRRRPRAFVCLSLLTARSAASCHGGLSHSRLFAGQSNPKFLIPTHTHSLSRCRPALHYPQQ